MKMRMRQTLLAKQNEYWEDEERRQGNEFEHPPKNSGAELGRPGEVLHKDMLGRRRRSLLRMSLFAASGETPLFCALVTPSGNWRRNSL